MAWKQPTFVDDDYGNCSLIVSISDELNFSGVQTALLMKELEDDGNKNEPNRRKKAYKKFYRWFDHLQSISAVYSGFEFEFSVPMFDLVPKSKRTDSDTFDSYLDLLRDDINDWVHCSTLVSNLYTITGESMWEWIHSADAEDYESIIETYIDLNKDCGYVAHTSDIIFFFDEILSLDEIEKLLIFPILNGAVVQDHVKSKQTWEFPNGTS